jgi:ABC-type Fe3+ transport system permease subunit
MSYPLAARYLPLVGHVVPTVVIGYGWVIPGSCIAGWNELTVGFGLSVLGTCVSYFAGLRAASRWPRVSSGNATA